MKLLYSTLKSKDECGHFPQCAADFATVKVIKPYLGKSSCVFEIELGNNLYILKIVNSAQQLKLEVLADVIYQHCAVLVPDFMVFKGFSKSLRQALETAMGHKLLASDIFKLSIKVDGEVPTSEQLPAVYQQLCNTFVLDALLRNTRSRMRLKNFLLDADGRVWRLNNICDLRHFHVAELVTMKQGANKSALGNCYQSVSEVQINRQKNKILSGAMHIMRLLTMLNKALNLGNYVRLYDAMVARLHSLAFDRVSCVEQKAEKPLAAGMLNYAFVHGRYYVLLGCRLGTGEGDFCSLGGRAEDSDLTAAHTAAREVKEESMGLIDESADSICLYPYYDLKSSVGAERVKYRMYISQLRFVIAREFNRRLQFSRGHYCEYSEFIWISLQSLLSHCTQVGEIDIEVLDADGKNQVNMRAIRLLPDMKELLAQDVVREQLRQLPSKPHRLPATRKVTSQLIAKQMIARMSVLIDIQSHFKATSATEMVPSSVPCLSERQLAALYDDITLAAPIEEKVRRFLKRHALKSYADYDLDFNIQVIRALYTERAYQARGYVTLYHAVPKKIAIIYDICSLLYKRLHHSCDPRFKRFRMTETPYRSFPTLASLMWHYGAEGAIHNYDAGFMEMVISCNLFLFGSNHHYSEASYQYFVDNFSARNDAPFAEHKLVDNLLRSLCMQDALRAVILSELSVFAKALQAGGSSLHQIFIAADEIDSQAYLSSANGRKYQRQGKAICISSLLASLTSGDINQEDLTYAQARLFLRPELYKQAKIIEYKHHRLTRDSEKMYQQFISDITNHILETLFTEGTSSYITLGSPAAKIYRYVSMDALDNVNEVEPQQVLGAILQSREYHQLIYFRLHFPNFKSEEADAISRKQAYIQIISKALHGKNTKQVIDKNYLLGWVAYFNLSQLLVECVKAGADVNQQDNMGSTPLMDAYHGDSLSAFLFILLMPGVDLLKQNYVGENIFDIIGKSLVALKANKSKVATQVQAIPKKVSLFPDSFSFKTVNKAMMFQILKGRLQTSPDVVRVLKSKVKPSICGPWV